MNAIKIRIQKIHISTTSGCIKYVIHACRPLTAAPGWCPRIFFGKFLRYRPIRMDVKLDRTRATKQPSNLQRLILRLRQRLT